MAGKKYDKPGQPTKYDAKRHPIELVHLMRELGLLLCEICSLWDICEDTFHEWRKVHKEFSEAYKRARTAKRAWWVNEGRKGLHCDKGATFNATVWSMLMRTQGINTEDRGIELAELNEAVGYMAQSDVIRKAVSDGRITPKEAKALQDMIASAAKLEEFTELKEQVEALQEKLGRQN